MATLSQWPLVLFTFFRIMKYIFSRNTMTWNQVGTLRCSLREVGIYGHVRHCFQCPVFSQELLILSSACVPHAATGLWFLDVAMSTPEWIICLNVAQQGTSIDSKGSDQASLAVVSMLKGALTFALSSESRGTAQWRHTWDAAPHHLKLSLATWVNLRSKRALIGQSGLLTWIDWNWS